MQLSETRSSFALSGASQTIDRAQINFSRLHKLRWAAIAGQLTTIFVVRDWMGIELPAAKMLAIIGVAAATNVGFGLWLRYRSPAWPRWAWRGDWVIGSLMMLDNLLLTALLYYSGGPANPFTIFYLVNIALAAVVLRPLWAWILDGAAFLCFAMLFVVHVSLNAIEHGPEHEHTMHSHQRTRTAAGPMSLHLQGSLIAFGGAATFIVYFITRVTSELARREAELNEARQRKAQTDKFEALATLAAGAAHELATPLSTIAILARELELSLAEKIANDENVQDIQLIRSEVDRCRRILHSMASGAGESIGEELTPISASELLTAAMGDLAAADRIDISVARAVEDSAFKLPKQALAQALRGIIQNALDASAPSDRVKIDCSQAGGFWMVTITDRGVGMTGDVLKRAGEPFFTTKEPGAGMGLGLFLARRVIERLGGSLSLESIVRVGTIVTIRLPVENLAAVEFQSRKSGSAR
jgi:two-component system sensor histidine kinase RegB